MTYLVGFLEGLEVGARIADYLGGDRYQRPDYSRRDPYARLQQTIEAQHLRAHTIAVCIRNQVGEVLSRAQPGQDETRPTETGRSE